MFLAALGEVSYNGVTFNGTSKVSVNVEFVMDEAGRTVLYHQHTFRVSAIYQNDAGNDADIETVRKALGEQGRAFRFTSRGFGDDIIVNSAGGGGMRDVRFGPKPRILSWKPVAGNAASEIEWECVVCLAMCDGYNIARFQGLMALNYGITFAVSQKGYTTRTIAGYFQVAMTRAGRLVPDTADNYLNALAVNQPFGFLRNVTRQLSSDKSRLDFQIVDTQIESPNAYPPGVIDISLRHRAGWRRGSGLPRNTISGSIEVAVGTPPEHALLMFSAIANQRIRVAETFVPQATSVKGGVAATPVTVLIDEFQVEEDIYGRSSSFMLGYRVPASLAEFIPASGMWTPTNHTWPQWHNSVQQAHSAEGYSGLRHDAEDDRITDLCVAEQTTRIGARQLNELYARPALPATKNKRPEQQTSWLYYDQKVTIYRQRPIARQAVLQAYDVDFGSFSPNQSTGIVYPPNAGRIDTIQQGGQSRYYAVVQGTAARAGHEIPRPQYSLVGIREAVEIEGEFQQAIVEVWFGCPVYGASWYLVYALEASPEQVELMANPKEFVNGRGQRIPG